MKCVKHPEVEAIGGCSKRVRKSINRRIKAGME